jgi:hypothetical protein
MKFTFFCLFSILTIHVHAQWRVAYQGTDSSNEIVATSFISPSTGYVASNKWIGFTSDSGHTITPRFVTLGNVDYNSYLVGLTLGFSPQDVHVFSVDTFVVSGHYGFEPSILYTTNGGLTWKLVYHRDLNTTNVVNAVWSMAFPGNGSTGFAVQGDEIIRTTDRGKTWQAIISDPNQSMFDIVFANNSVAYVAGPNRLWQTTNGGSNWTLLSNFNFTIKSIAAFGQHVFVNTSVSDNFYSDDEGMSWTQANTEISQAAFWHMYYINDTTGYGTGFGIAQTKNKGKTWEQMQGSEGPDTDHPYFFNKLTFFNNQLAWAARNRESLMITTNGGGLTYPRALFDVNTSTLCTDDTIRLTNRGYEGYSYRWFKNDTLFATTYNASYKVSSGLNYIKLVVTNALGTDSMVLPLDAAAHSILTLNVKARRDTVCSNGNAYFDVFNSRPDVLYRLGRECCGYIAQYGNGSTLTLAINTNAYEDTATTFIVTAHVNGACGEQTAIAYVPEYVVRSDPPTTALIDTVCTQNTFYIKVPNSRIGYQYWSDPEFPKVNGTGATIQLPCRVSAAGEAYPIDDLTTSYRFPLFAQHATQFCGGGFPAGQATIIGRRSQANFEILGYDWLSGSNLVFENHSRQAETYTWQFTGGSNSSSAAVPTDIAFNTGGYKVVKLVAYTHEGCADSATRTIEIIQSNSRPASENICPSPSAANVVDSVTDRKYFLPRSISEDRYGNRIIAGGFTTSFSSFGYEGWFVVKYNKSGSILWKLRQSDGDELGTYNANTHIVIEHAISDSLGYTYLLGQSLNRSAIDVAGQDRIPIPTAGAFLIKVSPAGRILWAKTFYNRETFFEQGALDYTGGSLLLGKNNDLYIVTQRLTDKRFFTDNTMLYSYDEGYTGVIIHMDKNGNVLRTKNFPINYNNMRQYTQSAKNYDALPPAVWDSHGNLVVCGDLNSDETKNNSIDGVPITFNSSLVKSCLLYFDTTNLQVTAIRPIYETISQGGTGVTTEAFAVDSSGNYYASYRDYVVVPISSLAYQSDTLKPKSFIAAYDPSGDMLWTKQAEGLRPTAMVAFNDVLKIAGPNYVFAGYTNAAISFTSNESPAYHDVQKLTTIGDVGSFSGDGSYGIGSLDLAILSLRKSDGRLISLSDVGTTKEDENVIMTKGYGDLLWMAGTVGTSNRFVTNYIRDTISTVYTYKIAAHSDCSTAYQTMPGFVELDLRQGLRYCVDSTAKIYWSSNGVSQVNILYSTDNGLTFKTTANGVPASPGFYAFDVVKANVSGNVKFKVESIDGSVMDTATIELYPNVIPSVTIATSSNIVCATSNASFTATPAHGGPAPSYQWYIDNGLAGNNSPNFTFGFYPNNDNAKVSVAMSSNAACATPLTVRSNAITISVKTSLNASISITGNTSVNPGDSSLFTATFVNGGPTPSFQWEDSTSLHSWQTIPGATSPSYTYKPAATGDRLRCKMTTSFTCASPTVSISETKIFSVGVATGISPVPAVNKGIHFYPNPVNHTAYIDTLKLADKWYNLEVVGIDGKHSFLSMNIANRSNVSVNVSQLAAGVYIAILRRRSGGDVYVKFIKN